MNYPITRITMSRTSENRRIHRRLLRLSKKGRLRTGDTEKVYLDNKGMEYPFAFIARVSSFFNVLSGCFRNGFPIAVPRLWYTAWAFYPFFFVRRNLNVDNPIAVLNHERIHIRQQRDIHLTISLPLIVLCGFAEWFGWFNPLGVLWVIPFIPTILYGVEMLRSYRNLVANEIQDITFNKIRENTCFERESISRATNADYLFNRKFWAVLAYTGWKPFQKYGIK